MARASALKRVGGKLVSAKSKTGDPACSAAMSQWKTRGMTPAIASQLGKCRAMARLRNKARDQRNAGREGMAANLEKRAGGQYVTQKERLARAQELRAKRAEKRQQPAAAHAAPKAQGRGTAERIALARAIKEARKPSPFGDRKLPEPPSSRFKNISDGLRTTGTFASKEEAQSFVGRTLVLDTPKVKMYGGLSQGHNVSFRNDNSLTVRNTYRATKPVRTKEGWTVALESRYRGQTPTNLRNVVQQNRSQEDASLYISNSLSRARELRAQRAARQQPAQPSLREQAAAARAKKAKVPTRAGNMAAAMGDGSTFTVPAQLVKRGDRTTFGLTKEGRDYRITDYRSGIALGTAYGAKKDEVMRAIALLNKRKAYTDELTGQMGEREMKSARRIMRALRNIGRPRLG